MRAKRGVLVFLALALIGVGYALRDFLLWIHAWRRGGGNFDAAKRLFEQHAFLGGAKHQAVTAIAAAVVGLAIGVLALKSAVGLIRFVLMAVVGVAIVL